MIVLASEHGSFRNCCLERGVSHECSAQCTFNTSLTVQCMESADVWIQCASDGHDHSKCCFESGNLFLKNCFFLLFFII